MPTLLASPTASRKPCGYGQSTDATNEGGEIAALRSLLEHVELEGVLVQADGLHASRPFSTSRSAVPTS